MDSLGKGKRTISPEKIGRGEEERVEGEGSREGRKEENMGERDAQEEGRTESEKRKKL